MILILETMTKEPHPKKSELILWSPFQGMCSVVAGTPRKRPHCGWNAFGKQGMWINMNQRRKRKIFTNKIEIWPTRHKDCSCMCRNQRLKVYKGAVCRAPKNEHWTIKVAISRRKVLFAAFLGLSTCVGQWGSASNDGISTNDNGNFNHRACARRTITMHPERKVLQDAMFITIKLWMVTHPVYFSNRLLGFSLHFLETPVISMSFSIKGITGTVHSCSACS